MGHEQVGQPITFLLPHPEDSDPVCSITPKRGPKREDNEIF